MLFEQSGYDIPQSQRYKEAEEHARVAGIVEIIKPNTNVYIPAVIQNCKIVGSPNSAELKQVYECNAYSLLDPIKATKVPVQVFVDRDDFVVTNPYDNMPAEELVKALERKGYKVSITQNIEGGITND
jgi:hypothetical protein